MAFLKMANCVQCWARCGAASRASAALHEAPMLWLEDVGESVGVRSLLQLSSIQFQGKKKVTYLHVQLSFFQLPRNCACPVNLIHTTQNIVFYMIQQDVLDTTGIEQHIVFYVGAYWQLSQYLVHRVSYQHIPTQGRLQIWTEHSTLTD